MGDNGRTGPLEDLTVLDCTMAYAGPFGTSLLADLGANVIKVEPPSGDAFRLVPPHPPGYRRVGKPSTEGADYGTAFASVNANKRSVCLDLKQAADRELLLQLCQKADAIVENMRAGVMDGLGLGYEAIAARNPSIVYGTVRGYGDARTGASPYGEWPCLDVAGQAAGGLVEATGDLVPEWCEMADLATRSTPSHTLPRSPRPACRTRYRGHTNRLRRCTDRHADFRRFRQRQTNPESAFRSGPSRRYPH